MKQTMIVLAAMLIGATAYAAEKPGASKMSPGHEMQNSPTSTTKGASEYSPGDKMKDKGTVGRARGASENTPGDRMNDKRKKY
ncbi:MAG TPA: hypothetical protein VKR55_25540 [Bradyrhizobium sp.]|uniref:hypothetical protein n=1 Tax=Bradyrhizobium sp. TaxID=376 RepID=UPI002D0D7429|nr:hypothetical protein [Bradyrhizobium sp.]HLZ05500.1 hypothetical protein [Bradyrhizobium sp.]